MRAFVFAVAALGLSSLAAHADQMFTLSGVNLYGPNSVPEGTLTGTFTTNNALNTILSFDITASASGAFTGFEYTTSDATVTASVLPSQFFQIDSSGFTNELRLYFTNGLSPAGGQISEVFSYESEPSGGNRFPGGKVVSAVTPEPSSFVLLGSGILGIAGLLRKRFQ